MDKQTRIYAETLSRMIRLETISDYECKDNSKFVSFRALLRELFPSLFRTGTCTEFEHGFVLKWSGADTDSRSCS